MPLGEKLARLPPLVRAERASDPAGSPGVLPDRPTLDQLRDRIAQVLARGAGVRAPTAGPASFETELDPPFFREETAWGPLDRAVRPTPHGHRVGAMPVWAARTADPALLALLALDPTLAQLDPSRALYLDTETTGLSGGAGTVPFLVGLGFYEDDASPSGGGRFVVEQLLLKGLGDEAPILEHLRRRIEACSMLVTFNGKAFDLPLLRTRAVLNRVAPLAERPHLDLLHVARRLHKHRLASCSLQTLESLILGRERVGDVAGADIAAIYHHYLRSGDEGSLNPIVEHNALDVISMFALVGLYGEPLEQWGDGGLVLAPSDLSAAAKVARRARDLDRALVFAERSVTRGAGAVGHQARADVAKARGDKASALLAYEAALALATAADAESLLALSLRHELAKLYEHHARAYERAIAVVAQGTTEAPDAQSARLSRLVKKKDRAAVRPAKKRRTTA